MPFVIIFNDDRQQEGTLFNAGTGDGGMWCSHGHLAVKSLAGDVQIQEKGGTHTPKTAL